MYVTTLYAYFQIINENDCKMNIHIQLEMYMCRLIGVCICERRYELAVVLNKYNRPKRHKGSTCNIINLLVYVCKLYTYDRASCTFTTNHTKSCIK